MASEEWPLSLGINGLRLSSVCYQHMHNTKGQSEAIILVKPRFRNHAGSEAI